MATALEITGYGSPALSMAENQAIFQKWVDLTRENADMEARLWVSTERGIRSIEAATGVVYLPPVVDVSRPKPVRSETSVRGIAMLRMPDLMIKLACSRAHVYELMDEHGFPASVHLGGAGAWWYADEVEAWLLAHKQAPRNGSKSA